MANRLQESGYEVTSQVVPDDQTDISSALRVASQEADLVVTTGGTGFGVRDVTPEATLAVLDRQAPGLVHAMVASGLEQTPMAALTRAVAGTMGAALVVNLPGSPKGALENLNAVIALFPHIHQLLSGDNRHH